VLRHPNDRLKSPTRITTVEDVLGRPALARVPAAAAPPVQPPLQTFSPPPQQPTYRPPTPMGGKIPSSLPKKRGRFEEL